MSSRLAIESQARSRRDSGQLEEREGFAAERLPCPTPGSASRPILRLGNGHQDEKPSVPTVGSICQGRRLAQIRYLVYAFSAKTAPNRPL